MYFVEKYNGNTLFTLPFSNISKTSNAFYHFPYFHKPSIHGSAGYRDADFPPFSKYFSIISKSLWSAESQRAESVRLRQRVVTRTTDQ